MLQCGNNLIFPGKEIRTGKVDAGDCMMCDERAVTGQILHKELQFLQHFLLGKRGKRAGVCPVTA